MGNNPCSKQYDYQRQSLDSSKEHKLISSVRQNDMNDKIHEIKEFLTLSSQNAPAFYSRHSQLNDNQAEKESKSISDFQVVRGLGKGAFGQVFLVKDKIKNKCYAMKIISKDAINNDREKLYTLSERFILEAMDHPFIVKLHYAFQTKSKLYLLVDLMAGGELFYLLRRNRKFPESVAKFYAAQILMALEHIHTKNIIYRDLKPENILLDRQGHVKLTDFGLSKVCYHKDQITYSICGTPQYIAPQIIQGKGYTYSADWFSFGSLIYDMLTGKPPFYSKNKRDMLKNIKNRQVPIPQDLSEESKSLLKGLFKIKPADRLGTKNDAAQIKQHPFFSDIDFEKLANRQIKPPIAFVESQINVDGFDKNFEEQLKESAFQSNTLGFGFDGFTYLKPQIPSLTNKDIQQGQNSKLVGQSGEASLAEQILNE